MRYEDTSSSVSNSATPEARNDADALATGSNGPATGNVITGAGTLTGLAGADGAPNGHVVEIRGAGGTDTAENGQSMHVDGRFGALVIDEHGSYKYVADGHAPADFRDLFQYTLVDAKGGRSVADLMITRGAELKVADNAQRIVPGPDGVVTLPAGVDLNDVHVLGRDLIVTLPDGSQIVIVDGAVFVPQLVLGGVEVPSTNLASLLVQSELNTGAGPAQSSGGNFDVPVPPLDPGVPLGDLIPPTELVFTPPEIKEIGQFIDKHPDAGTVSVVVDDDDVPGKNGNPGGTGDDAPSNTAGFLPGSGGDGALTWDLSNGGAPAGFSYIDGPNGSILVQQVQGGNTVTVLTITVDAATGAYTVTENAPVLHAAGDNENNALFTINYTVTDSDGDVAAGTLNISVDDDTPTVNVTAGSDAEVSLTTHDALTPGAGSEAVSTTANFSNVFGGTSSSPGADGAGAGSTSGYALSTTGGASGLFSHGVAINLYNVGGVIVGSTSATAPATATDASVVFSVSTTNTGIVTLTQYQQIDHTADPHPTGAPFTDDIMSLVDGSITLTRSLTVVDKDGDSVTGSASVGIGANLHFVDDGPTIGIADRGEPSLVVDETDLGTNATASFAANFGASFGADGPAAAGSITYALGINAGASGLIDVATGSAIVLVQNGAVVEGHVGSAAGALAFTVSVNAAGDVTLDQIRALQHPDATNPNDNVTLANDNLVTLTATAHDFDGDTASSTLNIGTDLNFHDDGPSISASENQPSLTVDETNLAANATASFAGLFTSSFGADGAGTVTYALAISAPGANSGLVDVATGSAIVLVLNGGVVEGHVGNAAGALAFTVSINAAGDVTLDQIRAVVHPDANNPNDSVTLGADNLVAVVATVTDKDGDTATATANIGQNLNFLDDGPSISAGGVEPSLTVDETNLATNATASFAGVFTPVFGADGAGNVSYALSISAPGANSGLIDVATGSAIVLVQNGNVVEGHVGTAAGALAFTVSVNAAGDVTLDQIRAVQHPDANNPNDSVTLSSDNLVVLTATVTDKDGDHASASTNIGQNLNFLDDGPSISASGEQPTLTVDETVLATNATASFAGVFTSSFGADGAGTVTYALGISAPGANSGLVDVATGSAIVLVQNGAVVEGHVGNAAGALAFTVTVDASGNVTLDQIRAVVHPDANNSNDSVTLSADNLVTLSATVTDKDGDHQSATANIGQNLNFLDDGPSINANGAQPTLTVDETVLATNASASFAGVFNSAFGADGAGTVTYALGISAPGANSGLVDTLTGSAIVLVQNGSVVEGHVGTAAGALAFTVTVDASGNVTLDQIRAVVHSTSSNPDTSEGVTLSADNLVTLTATVTDKDGDHQSATANIGQNLVFNDDGPTAINDSDTIASGGNSATGNVITGIGTDGGIATADNAGADQPGHISQIQGSGGTDTTFTAGLLSIAGTYGTLAMDADGNYTYTRNAGAPGSVDDVFTYTLRDADGDTTTATLTIHINDAAPNPPTPVVVLLDDDALPGGNAGGPGDRSPDTQNTSGSLVATGGDGDLDYFIAASQSLPTGFTSTLNTVAGVQTMAISQNGVLVITVTLDNETGAYTVTQNAPIMHALDGNTEGEIPLGNILSAINVNVFSQDADGDQSANSTISISVDDDTPTVIASGTQPTLTVDETNLATNATASFSGVFTDSFGADGPALAGSVAYALGISAPGANSGLIDVATGSAIVLVLNGNVVEGHVGNAAGALAFTVSVNAAGDVTLDQIRALSHPDANNPNDSVSPSADNLVTLTQTITDKDGDQSSATANIGQNLVFQDDGPSISTTGVEPSLTVDETNLAANASASFAANFTSAFGADGAGAVTYALTVTGGNGVASGLIDVATGSAIVLVNNAGVIEGHVATTGGLLAFTVTVDASGNVTLDQVRAVQHPDANNPNDSVSLTADNLVVLTATVTDKDGDHQSAALNIGQNLNFLDDGPSISLSAVAEPTLTVDETNLATNATASFAANFTSAFGADGAGAVTYALGITGANGVASGLIDVATGSAIVLVNNAGVIEGHVATTGGALAFTVTVNAGGSVTLDQIRAVQHPDANNPNDSVTLSADNLVTLTATVTDKDGDHQSATANIGQNLVFQDDGPSISLAAIAEPTLTVDETVLATNATASFAASFTSAFGADGAGAVTYALTITGANGVASGLIDVATGSAIVLVNNAGVIEGHVATTGGALAFTVTVNAGGSVTLDQIRAVQHPDANNPNDSVSLSADNLVVLTATVTDKDGDHQSAALNIGQNLSFLDDGPSISLAAIVEPTLTVDETVLATNATAAFAGSFTSAFGADGAGTVTYAVGISAPLANSGLVDTATGLAIVLVQNGSVVEGHVGTAVGALAFTVAVDASGNVTLDQIRAVVHPNPLTPNESVSLSADNLVTLTATVTDKDGDHQSATLNIGQNLVFQDDAPTLGVVQNQQTDNNPATAPAVGTLHFTPGADGAGTTMTITANVAGLTSGGHTLVTHQVGNVLTAYQDIGPAGYDAGDITPVFTITVDTSGVGHYTFDLINPLDPTVTETAIGGSTSFGAGPTAGQTLDSAAAVHLSVVSGYHMGGTFNEASWLSTGDAGPTTNYVTAGVNGSTAGWGIDNNNFNGTDEMFVWDFGSQALRNPDGAGGFVPPAGVTLPDISTATYQLIGYTAADDITYVVHYTDGTFDSGHIPAANMTSGTWKFTADPGKFIGDIEMFSSGTGSGKVDLESVGIQSTNLDKTIAASVTLTDGDGDSTTTGNFTIHIATGLSPAAPVAPVVLDLNGDGVHFLATDAGVHYDYGNGSVATAWASAQDGILVNDANHNGTVDNASEFVFGSGSVTDLQALAAYDSNHDGQLSSADANFANFAVWQDANSNGVADAGEVQTLTARGIASISLSSDGIAYAAAGGDVQVAGTGSYTNANGSTGSLADAAFLTAARAADDARVSSSVSNTALLGAIAAAGLASQAAAAATTHASLAATTAMAGVAVAHNQALAPVALDYAPDMHASTLLSPQVDTHGLMQAQASIMHAADFGESQMRLDAGHGVSQPATQFLQATQMPTHSGGASVTAASIVMPSAQQLVAASNGGVAGVQHNQVVAQVLAEALHGGGGVSIIDHALASLPGHGGANAALAALASHAGAAVSNGDTGVFAAFTAAHSPFNMEAMAVHADAIQAHA
jgi:VCBS repeat-containing protein